MPLKVSTSQPSQPAKARPLWINRPSTRGDAALRLPPSLQGPPTRSLKFSESLPPDSTLPLPGATSGGRDASVLAQSPSALDSAKINSERIETAISALTRSGEPWPAPGRVSLLIRRYELRSRITQWEKFKHRDSAKWDSFPAQFAGKNHGEIEAELLHATSELLTILVPGETSELNPTLLSPPTEDAFFGLPPLPSLQTPYQRLYKELTALLLPSDLRVVRLTPLYKKVEARRVKLEHFITALGQEHDLLEKEAQKNQPSEALPGQLKEHQQNHQIILEEIEAFNRLCEAFAKGRELPAEFSPAGAIDPVTSLFDYINRKQPLPKRENGSYLPGILRGTDYNPVFATGDNWFTRGASHFGNKLSEIIGDAASTLVHSTLEHGVTFPLSKSDNHEATLGFSMNARKIREKDIPNSDPRLKAIEQLRTNYPGGLPVWLEGSLGANLSLGMSHTIPTSAGGPTVSFGFKAGAGASVKLSRLAYFKTPTFENLSRVKEQMRRLSLSPLDPENFKKMEQGASFELKGNASLRLDAALGLGASIPALTNCPPLNKVAKVGANVEAGAYASLAGEMSAKVLNKGDGNVSLTFGSGTEIGAGLTLKAFAGVELDEDALKSVLRGFVDYVADGGDPSAFESQLGNSVDKAAASSLSGYIRVLNKNLAEGMGVAAVNHLASNYGSIAFEARKGITINNAFNTSIDFEFESNQMVSLPRADMVPLEMRSGLGPDQPLQINRGKVSQLAYSLAIRGDMRLVQQLQYIRGAGVRINERLVTHEKSEASSTHFRLPFGEFRRSTKTATRNIDRFTTELGRTHTLVESFNYDYESLFGSTESSEVNVRVHDIDDKVADEMGVTNTLTHPQIYFPNEENFSADFVVKSLSDKWTTFENMQDFLGVFDALSNGKLTDRCAQALETGREWLDLQDYNPIVRFFEEKRAFGKTTAHLHVWLGESGLKTLLQDNWSEDELYHRIGEVFVNIDNQNGKTTESLPRWALPGADRELHRHGKTVAKTGGPASLYGLPKDPKNHQRLHADQSGLQTARYLVDNITRLSKLLKEDPSPAEEKLIAPKIRDFLTDCKDRLAAYAALAMLVPEDQRAAEMRLSSVREGKAPIRFTFIEDGRSSKILRATGFAHAAMAQFKLYGSTLDNETRLRVANLLKEIITCINSPSPDLFILDRAEKVLRHELETSFDNQATSFTDRITADIALARGYIDQIPSHTTIMRILPGPFGAELANLRINAAREANKASPNLGLLKIQLQNLVKRAATYREITQSDTLISDTGSLALKLQEVPECSARVHLAYLAIEQFRGVLNNEVLDPEALKRALDHVTLAHQGLRDAASEVSDLAGEIDGVLDIPVVRKEIDLERDLPGAREKAARITADKLKARSWQPISYFERTNLVPKTAILLPPERSGPLAITATQVRQADLDMANSISRKAWERQGIPQLATASKIRELLTYAKVGNTPSFLALVERDLRWKQDISFTLPETAVLDRALCSVPKDQRSSFLARIPAARHVQYNSIFADIDSDTLNKVSRTTHKTLKEVKKRSPNLRIQLDLFETLAEAGDFEGLGKAVEDTCLLGDLNSALTALNRKTVTCLEDVFAKLDGDTLKKLCATLETDVDKRRFLDIIKGSDLLPATRARLAGELVNNRFFWKKEEDLVEALVTGMTAADLRLFFDNLYAEGTLARFLSAGSWWQTFLEVFTLGIACLWTHDNKAALAVVAKLGWSEAELKLHYDAHLPLSERMEGAMESILLNSVVNTMPVSGTVTAGIYAAHSLCKNMKLHHIKELPKASMELLATAASGAGEALGNHIIAIAENGGTPKEILQGYKSFFEGLSPDSIKAQFGNKDPNGVAVLISKVLRDGALNLLKREAASGKNKFLTPELVTFLQVSAENKLMDPTEDGAEEVAA